MKIIKYAFISLVVIAFVVSACCIDSECILPSYICILSEFILFGIILLGGGKHGLE